jgi:alpha-tubulin suppressor-like RCC1 family protein
MAITFNGISIGLGVALTITPPPNPQNYLWGWGRNYGGALGLGDTNNRSSPVQVGLGYNTVSAGDLYTIAIKPNGTLWSWGHNSFGRLGLGDTTSVSSPVQVGALTTWYEIHRLEDAGFCALKT